jgi:hypothetical protein
VRSRVDLGQFLRTGPIDYAARVMRVLAQRRPFVSFSAFLALFTRFVAAILSSRFVLYIMAARA